MTTKEQYEDFIRDVENAPDHESFMLYFEEHYNSCIQYVNLYCDDTDEELLLAKINEDEEFNGWSGEILVTLDEVKAFIEEQKQAIKNGASQW